MQFTATQKAAATWGAIAVLAGFVVWLLAFGQLLGFVGVLIALPASAVLLVAIRRAWARYLSSQLYLGA